MNITMKTAWITNTGHTVTSATVAIEGVGDLNIEATLPPELQRAVSDYFESVARDRLRNPAQNPATHADLGQPIN